MTKTLQEFFFVLSLFFLVLPVSSISIVFVSIVSPVSSSLQSLLFFLNVPSLLPFLSLLSQDSPQGGRSWQPFGEGKNGYRKISSSLYLLFSRQMRHFPA